MLNTTPAEDDLLEFLTPEASGMPNIPEGGAIGDSFIHSDDSFALTKSCLRNPKELFSQSVQKPQNSYQEDSLTSETLKENFFSLNPSSSTQLTAKESFYSDEIINIDVENLPTNVNDDI